MNEANRALTDPQAYLGDFTMPPYSVKKFKELVSGLNDDYEVCQKELNRVVRLLAMASKENYDLKLARYRGGVAGEGEPPMNAPPK